VIERSPVIGDTHLFDDQHTQKNPARLLGTILHLKLRPTGLEKRTDGNRVVLLFNPHDNMQEPDQTGARQFYLKGVTAGAD
jgi:hypothetical protein